MFYRGKIRMKKKLIKDFMPEVKDCYYIYENGDVESLARKTPRMLKHNKKQNGYYQVHLVRDDGGMIYISVHRLVALAFIENPNNLFQVNHIDGDKSKNNKNNLQWITPKNNIRHAWDSGLSKARVGSKSNLSKTKESEAIEIIRLLRTKQYTDREISEITGASVKGVISKIRRKETWRHLTENDMELGVSQKRK